MSDRYRIILAKQAATDLEKVFGHIAQDSPSNASGIVGRILDALENLKLFPHRAIVEGQNPKLKHPVRSLAVQSYIVFFRVFDDTRVVRVLRVRHGARRRLKRFGK